MKAVSTSKIHLLIPIILSVLMILSCERTSQKEDDVSKRLQLLRSHPYLDLSPDPAENDDSNVIIHIKDKAEAGYNF